MFRLACFLLLATAGSPVSFAHVPVSVPVYEEDGFQYRPEAIGSKITNRTRAILTNSPSNPTGNLLSANLMKEIATLFGKLDSFFIVSDEIYHGLVYEGKEHSILEFNAHAFVINGFSKAFAMAGTTLSLSIILACTE